MLEAHNIFWTFSLSTACLAKKRSKFWTCFGVEITMMIGRGAERAEKRKKRPQKKTNPREKETASKRSVPNEMPQIFARRAKPLDAKLLY